MFLEAFKDYIDYLHSLATIVTGDITFLGLITAFVTYVTKSVVVFFWYLISFKWLVGFTEIPALFKQNYFAIFDAKSIFNVRFELEMDRGFFTFLETGHLNSNNLGTGFLNSFFLTLPLSVPQLLTLRALLVNGIPAGVFSALGTFVGQFFFFAFVLFGFEFLLLPWVSIQPILIILGSVLVLNLIYRMIHNPPLKEVEVSQRKTLFKYFRITLFLSWMEQVCVYSYFGNLTVTGTPTLLQTSDSNFLFSTFGYLLGLTLGSIIWTVLWGFGCIKLRNFLYNQVLLNFSTLRLNEKVHQFCLVSLATLCLASYPYYGMDYLAGQSVGFIADDQGLENYRLHDYYEIEQLDEDYPNEEQVFEFFSPESSKATVPNQNEYDYESSNYLVEQRWKNRENDRTRVTSETAKRQLTKYNLPKEVKPLFVKEYDSLRLEYEPEEEDEERRKLNPFDTICEEFLRPDIYVGYNDLNSLSYSGHVEVHREFRHKYFANPVYKTLLRLDTYPFLFGANREHNLSAEDEYNLYERKSIMQDYANSILSYKAKKTKSRIGFAHQVYNQQFKGSLNVIRQYNFARVHENMDRDPEDEFFDDERNKQNNLKVLKYDQFLYNSIPDHENMTLHEELEFNPEEEINRYNHLIEISNQSTPLYIGWDGALRKFLVKTNIEPSQMLSGDVAYADPDALYDDEGELMKNPLEEETKDGEKATPKPKKKKYPNEIPTYYSFQAWSPASEDPKLDSTVLNLSTLSLTDKQLENLKITFGLVDLSYNLNPLDDVKEMTQQDKDEIDAILQHLPHYNWFWKKIDTDFKMGGYLELGNTTPPQLDGFAWPGIRDPLIIRKVVSKVDINRNDYVLD